MIAVPEGFVVMADTPANTVHVTAAMNTAATATAADLTVAISSTLVSQRFLPQTEATIMVLLKCYDNTIITASVPRAVCDKVKLLLFRVSTKLK